MCALGWGGEWTLYCPHRFPISRPVTGGTGVTGSVPSPSFPLPFSGFSGSWCDWSQCPCGSVSPWVSVCSTVTLRVRGVRPHHCAPVDVSGPLCHVIVCLCQCQHVSLCAMVCLSAQWCFSARVIPLCNLSVRVCACVCETLCDSVCLCHCVCMPASLLPPYLLLSCSLSLCRSQTTPQAWIRDNLSTGREGEFQPARASLL